MTAWIVVRNQRGVNVADKLTIDFPAVDEWGTPLTKMPDCPRCGEDELGLIHPDFAVCYHCGFNCHREGGLARRLHSLREWGPTDEQA